METQPLHIELHGDGPDLLLLLHGMGATGAAWSHFTALAPSRWRGGVAAVDLPGHGASPPLPSYAIGQLAARVAQALLPHLSAGGRLVVLGHSLGGVIGAALASGWFCVAPQRVHGMGIKVAWSDEELARMQTLAAQAPRRFDDEAQARDRYLKVSGLAGLADASSPLAARGVRPVDDGGWQLAMDPRAFGVGKPPMAELLRLAGCPVHLARGAGDPMMTGAQLRALDPGAIDLGPHGHSVMAEAPERVWDWVEQAQDDRP